MTDSPTPLDRPLSQQETDEIRRRQQARARVMGIGLALLCVLFFAITIAKIGLFAP